MKVERIKTFDDSFSLYLPEIDETYHSRNGAYTESMHVFIRNGLSHCLQNCRKDHLKILEIGLGTGLNLLLTEIFIRDNFPGISFLYHGVEKYPLPMDVLSQLNYTSTEQELAFFRSVHMSEWHRNITLSKRCMLYKEQLDLLEFVPEHNDYDLVYFDAFAPEKQPEMWRLEVFQKLCTAMQPGAVLVTYCAKGVVRRRMEEAGFRVERLQGAPGKREMIRAGKRSLKKE